MKYAVYVNDNVFTIGTKEDCIAEGIAEINSLWNRSKKDITEYLETIHTLTNDSINEKTNSEVNFLGYKFEIKPFREKTYEVIYKITFEKDVKPNEDFFAREDRVLCYENKVDDIVAQFRKRLERNVYDDLSIRGETFDEMLGTEIECLQDEETAYDVLDTIHKKYHTIVVNEVKMN